MKISQNFVAFSEYMNFTIHWQFVQFLTPTNCQRRLWTLWQYGLWSFQTGGTKLEIFLPKNQHTQRKLLNFEFWING